MKRIGMIFLALLLLVLLVWGEAEKAETANLTIMIYMNGSNLESLQGQATKDIDEMLASGYDPDRINIVLYTGGCRKWKTGFSSDQNGLYLLDPVSREATCVELSDRSSMGAPETLSGFLNTAYTAFPAENYALILWDHGAGPLGGVCFDDLSEGDSLTLPEIGTALGNSPFGAENKLTFIGFDACLMACAETAALCAPYAEYLIASEEPEPGSGWNYGFTGGLTGTESGDVIGKQVVDCFREGLQAEIEKGKPLTLSVFDLKLTGGLNQALDRLFSVMKNDFDAIGYNTISRGRDGMRGVARSTSMEYDLVDLRDMAERYGEYAPEESAEVLSVLDQMTLTHFSTVSGDHGLSTYYPYYNKTQYRVKKTEFDAVNPCGMYREYISLFTENWLTGRSGIWKGLVPYEEEGGYALELTPEQMEEFAYARFTVAEDLTVRTDEQYSFIYRTEEVTLNGSGILYAEWDNKALFCMNSRGELIADKSLVYTEADGLILVPAILNRGDDIETIIGGGDINDNHLSVNLRFRREADDSLTLIDVLDTSDESLEQMTQFEVDLDDWEEIEIYYLPRYPSRDEGGIRKPYSDWEISDWYLGDYFRIDEDWHLCFTDQFLSNSDRIAVFSLYDVHGNAYGSEILHISNPNNMSLDRESKELLSTDRVTVSLTGIDLLTQPETAYALRFSASNLSEEEIELRITGPVINEKYTLNMGSFDLFLGELQPGETHDLSFVVSGSDMDWLPSVRVDTLRFTLTDGDDPLATCLVKMPVAENIASEDLTFGTFPYEEEDLDVYEVAENVFFKVKSCELVPDQTNLILLRGMLVNESDTPYSLETDFDFSDVYMNNKYLRSTGRATATDVQPFTETPAEIRVSAKKDELFMTMDSDPDNAYASLYDLSRIDTVIVENETSGDGHKNICLRFQEPVDLSGGRPLLSSAMLARTDFVSLELLKAEASGNYLTFTLRVGTAEDPVTMHPEKGTWSDGTEAYIDTDGPLSTDNDWINAITFVSGTELLTRLMVQLPDGGIRPDSALEFSLVLRDDRDTFHAVHADNIRIGFSEQACEDLRDEKGVRAEALSVHSGVINEITTDRQYIRKEVGVVGDLSAAARNLEIPLDGIEEDEIDRVMMFLVRRTHNDEYEDIWLPVYRKILKRPDDETIETKVSGLLLSAAEDDAHVWLVDERDRGQGIEFCTLSGIYFSAGNFPIADNSTLESGRKIFLDPVGGTASFDDFVFDTPLDPNKMYTEVATLYHHFAAEKGSDGRYPFITDMPSPSMIVGQIADITGKDLEMVLRPIVPEDEIYIVYAFEMKDGTRFSSDPIPW